MKNKLSALPALLLAAAALPGKAQNLLLHFDFSTASGSYVYDVGPNNVRASLVSGATVEEFGDRHVLNLGTGGGYFNMTSTAGELFVSTDNYTVSTCYYVDADYTISGDGYHLWSFSTSSACGSAEGIYHAYRVNAQRIATSTGGYDNETGYSVGTATAQGRWVHVAYTQSGTAGRLYIDGELVASIAGMPRNSTNFGTTAPSYCWLGHSPFTWDVNLGQTLIADFRLYDSALTAAQVATLAAETDTLTQIMRYGTAGDTSALSALVDEAESLLAGDTGAYLEGAVENLRDAALMGRGALTMGLSATALSEYEDLLTEALRTVRATEGLAFAVRDMSGAYDTDRGFVHPGGLHTQADFDRVKAQLEAGDSRVTAAWDVLLASEWSQSTSATYPVETIIRGGDSGQNYINAARGAHIAYENALRWKIAGTTANARHAVEVLMSWANTCTLVSGDSNWALASGLYGYEFAQAAELLRDYDGWSADDFETFKNWMLTVWYPGNIHFMRYRNGTWENTGNQGGIRPGHYWSNWPLCNALSLLSIGILCDDVYIYNQAMSYFKYDQVGTFPTDGIRTADPILNDGCTEFWGNLIVDVQDTGLETGAYGQMGQMQESGRDTGHAAMALGLAVDIAKTAWSQGDDLFGYMDNRLAAGIEFTAAATQNTDGLPWTDYKYVDCRTAWHNGWTMTAAAQPVDVRPYWATVIGHYESVLGVEMPWSEKAYASMGGDVAPSGSTSGAYDHLGFSVLMNTYDTQLAPDSLRPTPLTPLMELNGTQISHNELGGLHNDYDTANDELLAAGQTVTLMPQLPDGEENTGRWTWNTGQTTQQISVQTDKSYVYRVTYTNARGVESRQSFSIAVEGDATGSVNTYGQITYDGTTFTTDSLTVFYGDQVTLSIVGTGGYESYKWDDGSTGATLTTAPIVREREIVGAHVNQAGVSTPVTFRLGVKHMQVQTVVNGHAMVDTTEVTVTEGDRVVIGLRVPEMLGGCSYVWDDGTTSPTITLASASESLSRTLTYDVNGQQGQLVFTVRVASASDLRVAPGKYLVYNSEDDTYLTSVKSGSQPTFNALTESGGGDDPLLQVWEITENPEDSVGYTYNFQCVGDSLYISSVGRSSKLLPAYVYSFQQSLGTEQLEVHNQDESPLYWSWNEKNGRLLVTSKTAPSTFPFRLLPYDGTDGVATLTAAADGSSAAYYDLSGRRVPPRRRGVYIHGGRKVAVK